jgi:hypothetical protein
MQLVHEGIEKLAQISKGDRGETYRVGKVLGYQEL